MATAAAETLGLLWGWLWSESFWLPQNVSWADLEGPGDGYGYPRAQHVLSVFPLAVCIFSVRMLFERFIAKPCALRVGIKDSPVNKVEPNDTLEKVFVSVTKKLKLKLGTTKRAYEMQLVKVQPNYSGRHPSLLEMPVPRTAAFVVQSQTEPRVQQRAEVER